MSAESQALFHRAVLDYLASPAITPDAEELRAAAAGHLGASRPLLLLTQIYAEALEAGEHDMANRLADELVQVRAAERVTAGGLPQIGD